MSTLIHERVELARVGKNPTLIARLESGWAVLGDAQFPLGYCLLLPDPVVPSINDLTGAARGRFLLDMVAIGDALLRVTSAYRINYELQGNTATPTRTRLTWGARSGCMIALDAALQVSTPSSMVPCSGLSLTRSGKRAWLEAEAEANPARIGPRGTTVRAMSETRWRPGVAWDGRRFVMACTLLFILSLAAWRIACIRSGPDPDTDAYGHYVIARQLLDTPWNLKIHWVWLPFYHLLLAGGIALGATLDHVRMLNALLAMGPALLLAWVANPGRHTTAPAFERWLPYLAAALAAATPIAVQMGTTGQPESFFAVTLLGLAVLLRAERYGLAAAVGCVAVLTRYEAWAVVAAVGVVLASRQWIGRKPVWSASVCVVAPAACVVCWAGARALGGEHWFAFIRENQHFAEAALSGRPAAPSARVVELLRALLEAWPWALVALLAILGLYRTWRKEGVWFLAVPLGVTAFLIASSLSRSQLGLARQWVALVPFVALSVAHGVAQAAVWGMRGGEALVSAHRGSAALQARLLGGKLLESPHSGDIAFAAMAACLALGAFRVLETSLGDWRRHTAFGLQQQRAAAHFLNGTPTESILVCDEASVEVLSELPTSRFVRVFVSEQAAAGMVALARACDVYVMSWRPRMAPLLPLGELVYGEAEGNDTDLVAVRLYRPRHAAPSSRTDGAK